MARPVSNTGTGVYAIYCHENEKIYIGSSNRINLRFNHHRCDLRAGRHGNQHLQNAWNLYGEAAFSMSVILNCEIDDQLYFEQYYLDVWAESGRLFNRRHDAKSPKGVKWTEDEKAAKSAAMKANPSFKGRHHTESSKAMLSVHAKARFSDPSNNPFFGKKHTEESRKKVSEANRGHTRNIGRVCSDRCRAAVIESNKRRRGETRRRKEENPT